MNKEFTIAAGIATTILGYILYTRRRYYQHRGIVRMPPILPPSAPPEPQVTPKPSPTPTPVVPPREPPRPPLSSTHQAPLIADITAEVGAPIHNVLTASQVKSKILERTDRIRQRVEACPGAPKLLGEPQIQVTKSGGGLFSAASYFSTISWQSVWQDEYLYDNTSQCIKLSMMAMLPAVEKYVKSINIRKG